ncbi:MAG: hypothetical protein KF832_19690 [Caldilineaceae bacterium]|nr:hypothetical protein [Caldilineaceae bacterium]
MTTTATDTTARVVIARGAVQMQPTALQAIQEGKVSKGDVLTTARVAGILAAKQTATLIPHCHVVMLDSVAIDFTFAPAAGQLVITATVRSTGAKQG